MANKIADARRSLIRAKESAEQRLLEIENERRDIKASLKSLDAALKALARSDETQPPTKPVQNRPNHDGTHFAIDDNV